MGTSARYAGPKKTNPLIPSWLPPLPPPVAEPVISPGGAPPPPVQPPADAAPAGQPNAGGAGAAAHPAQQPKAPAPAKTATFQGSRTVFNRALSGGLGRNAGRQKLRSALSGYVSKGTGGSRNAARRMTTSMPSARHIAHFAQQVVQVGLPQALRQLGLNDVVGRPAEEVLGVLTDSFCPPGGTIDEAIARDAWNQTIESIIEQGVIDIAAMTPEQWQGALAEFITNSIETKVINDIGTELTRLPTDVGAVNQIQSDLHELVRGAVDDAIGNRLDGGQIMGQADLDGITREIYESAYDYIRDIMEETGNE